MKQFAVFSVGEEEFGIEIYSVVEILNPVKIYTIPDMPGFLSGVINLRGIVIPVLDMRKRFGIESRPEKERIVIVWVGGKRVGLYVDSVKEIMSFSPEEIFPSPDIFNGFKPEYLVGLGKKGERVIILLNTEAVLTAEEKERLGREGAAMETVSDERDRKNS